MPGYFEEPEDPVAKKCDENCLECKDNATNCTVCHPDDNFVKTA